MGNILATVQWNPTHSDELLKIYIKRLSKKYKLTEANPNLLLYSNKTQYGVSLKGIRLLFWNREEAIEYVETYAENARLFLEGQNITKIKTFVEYLPI
uniref:Uncharacterized protein n=1 Tax=Marseillevirus LCMAC102 TaxID=2506603 RepID=A0A481YTR8_9VIRU|nr:MAG: hypothetical protein LCMAC102_01220 [Marseillevirus LCMAC102]